MKKLTISIVLCVFSYALFAQTLFVPGGMESGIGSSSGGNVGIGISNPSQKLVVFGDGPILRIQQNPGIAGAAGIELMGAGTGPKSFIRFHNGGAIWSQSGGVGTGRLEFGSADRVNLYMTLLMEN